MIKLHTINTYSESLIKKSHDFAEEYKLFLDNSKTERECTSEIEKMLISEGFVKLDTYITENKEVSVGDKIYSVNMNKSIVIYKIGKDSILNGMNIVTAHMDSPRIDIKQNPLYEEGGFAYFDTHYYGGIKKYQWVTMPLAIHGIVIKKDRTKININIGENDEDPVFCISDLLIHLSQEQLEKKAGKVIDGEALDLLVGNVPVVPMDKETKELRYREAKNRVKFNVLNILNDKYDIHEKDLESAEIEIVPAGKARDIGFDRSMIISYGQDDKVGTYVCLKSIIDVDCPSRTACCILVDKEEIGSVGATSMTSLFFENSLMELLSLMGMKEYIYLRRVLAKSNLLSSDVSAAYDPLYSNSFEKRNAAYMGCGVVINKYLGSRGKSGTNDANAEYCAYLCSMLEKYSINFQTSEMGKVDIGGGGTVSYILAKYCMNVIDCGVPVLNMHAPWEITSKLDIYEMYRMYCRFMDIDTYIQ